MAMGSLFHNIGHYCKAVHKCHMCAGPSQGPGGHVAKGYTNAKHDWKSDSAFKAWLKQNPVVMYAHASTADVNLLQAQARSFLRKTDGLAAMLGLPVNGHSSMHHEAEPCSDAAFDALLHKHMPLHEVQLLQRELQCKFTRDSAMSKVTAQWQMHGAGRKAIASVINSLTQMQLYGCIHRQAQKMHICSTTLSRKPCILRFLQLSLCQSRACILR